MKILLALNIESLENYIATINNVEILDIVRIKNNLINKIILLKPEVIFISHNLPGSFDMKDIIEKITSKDFGAMRIIYLYGEEDSNKKVFINYLISRGVYDYYVGSTLNNVIVNNLLFNVKSRDDVKHDILPSIILNTGVVSVHDKNIIQKDLDPSVSYNTVTSVIAFGGANKCVGCTHVSILMAKFLERAKYNVAFIELGGKKDVLTLNQNPKLSIKDRFSFKGIDFFTDDTILIDLLNSNSYDFIILDVGQLKRMDEHGEECYTNYYNEFLRSYVKILVCNSKPWQKKDIEFSLLHKGNSNISKKWYMLLNFADDKSFKEISYELDGYKVNKVPFCPDLFSINREICELGNLLFGEFVNKNKKNSIIKNLFKK